MGMINWIFDIYQHSKIDAARHETQSMRAELAQLRASGGAGSPVDAARLEEAIGALALATKTVQRMLVDKGVCTPAEFAALLDRIDGEDGRRDGQAPLP